MVNRGEQVEQLIARYGLITVDALSATVFQGLSGKAAERVVTRLLKAERIHSNPLFGRKCFYTLAAESARSHGCDSGRCHFAMGAQALLQNYAMMAFCLLGPQKHVRLSQPEIVEKFGSVCAPKVFGKNLRTRYYLDARDRSSGIVRLSLMIPDLGSHPRRLVRKVRRQVEKRRAIGGWLGKLIDARLFSVSILTAFAPKARQLSASLADERFHFRVELVPGYGDLLGFLDKGGTDAPPKDD